MSDVADCEVCGARNLRSVLDLGQHPLCDDLVRIGDTRVCKNYPIEILFCDTCYTAHQRHQVPREVLFTSVMVFIVIPLVAAWLYGGAPSVPYAVAAFIILAAGVMLSRD